jgi:hypothetical protein
MAVNLQIYFETRGLLLSTGDINVSIIPLLCYVIYVINLFEEKKKKRDGTWHIVITSDGTWHSVIIYIYNIFLGHLQIVVKYNKPCSDDKQPS